jgi:hypothetical protein
MLKSTLVEAISRALRVRLSYRTSRSISIIPGDRRLHSQYLNEHKPPDECGRLQRAKKKKSHAVSQNGPAWDSRAWWLSQSSAQHSSTYQSEETSLSSIVRYKGSGGEESVWLANCQVHLPFGGRPVWSIGFCLPIIPTQ